MYWTDIWQPTVHAKQNIFPKIFIEVGSPHSCASFGTFCVTIGRSVAAQRVLKHSEEFRNRRHFPSMTAICRFSNILQRLTVPRIIDQFRLKGAKRSVKIWAATFYDNFPKNILRNMNCRLSKIRSFHTYIMHRMFYFERYCMKKSTICIFHHTDLLLSICMPFLTKSCVNFAKKSSMLCTQLPSFWVIFLTVVLNVSKPFPEFWKEP